LASKYYKIKVIKLEAVGHINLKNNPYIIRLKKENEEISDLLKLKPEELLMRWFNYHLKNAGHDRQVNNFSKDIQDGENYTILLNQLDPKQCDKSAL
jgi:plastin-1